jgi:rhamnosyltransferase
LGTYSGETFLPEKLLSLENQSYKNWRLLIIDHGSTDATLTISREFQEKSFSYRLEDA